MSEVRNLRSNYVKQKYAPGWVPFAGSKRKAPMDDVATDYDVEAPPPKQFAIDDEVVSEIAKDGYLMSDAAPEPEPVPEVEMDDDEAEDETSPVSFRGTPRHPGKKAKRRLGVDGTVAAAIDCGTGAMQEHDGDGVMETAE